MPASVLGALLIIASISLVIPGMMSVSARYVPQISQTVYLQPASELQRALSWLVANQSADGSYGAFLENEAAAAGYALWLNNSKSSHANEAYSYLANQVENPSTWFWASYGEADFAGNALYSIGITQHVGLMNDVSSVGSRLLRWQKPNGGFVGYYDLTINANVTSSVDTAMAVWGLKETGVLPNSNGTSAVNYLLSLQNSDGSFNLTSTIASDQIDSLGPDSTSTTALCILVLRDLSFTSNDAHISKALSFLNRSLSADFNGHVYASSLSALAFMAYSEPSQATVAAQFILSQQNRDGGFSDTLRSSYPSSNALDTGWAAIALQLAPTGPSTVNEPPTVRLAVSSQNPSVGATVQFTGKGSSDPDGDALSYQWYFGDGGAATGVNATHAYQRSGAFTVSLKVTDSGTNPGPLSETGSKTVTVSQTVVQNSPSLPSLTTGLSIVAGVVVLVAIIGLAFYIGRRSGRGQEALAPYGHKLRDRRKKYCGALNRVFCSL